MRRKMAMLILVCLFAGMFLWWGVFPSKIHAFIFSSSPSLSLASPTAVASSTSSNNTPSSGGSLDPVIVAALIGLVGVVVVAVIGGIFGFYQMRRVQRVEKERQAEQFRHEEDMARFQKELERQNKAKEQEEQSKATTAEALRLKMLLAPASERLKTYQAALHADPRISQLQILDMPRPLEITNVFIQVRVHQESRPSYELDRHMHQTEAQLDPNILLQESFQRLEGRVSSALEPDEAIRQYKRCVFVGDPGAGKTTLLKYLTLKSADGALDQLPDLPIRVELNAFVTSGFHDLFDFAASEWDERYNFPKVEARAAMEARLNEGNVLLLLDALDETVVGDTAEVAETSYQQVVDTVIQIATRYPLVPIVVTARKAGYHQRSSLLGFTELEVLDFRFEDIQAFVDKWFMCYTDQLQQANGTDLKNKLEQTPRIRALAANPLLLSLIVLVYEAQLDLPDRRAELYKECVETLLTKWDAKRNIRRRREFKPEHKRQLLAAIAWHFHCEGRRYFPENELRAVIAEFLPTVHLLPEQNGQILAEIANEQGLLKEQARGWQGFLHLTLQEYFVAQYVADHQQLKTLLVYGGDPWWEEVTLLFAGYTPDASPLLHAFLEPTDPDGLPDDIFHTYLLTAGRCLAARPTLRQVTLWETIIHRLFEFLVTAPYRLTTGFTAETLAAIGDSTVNNRLVSLLTDEHLSVGLRRDIALALGRLGERSVAPQLVSLLSDEHLSAGLRGSIADALGELINDIAEISSMVKLLFTNTPVVDERIADSMYSALWKAGQRLGVRMFIFTDAEEKQIKIVKRSTLITH